MARNTSYPNKMWIPKDFPLSPFWQFVDFTKISTSKLKICKRMVDSFYMMKISHLATKPIGKKIFADINDF